MTQDGWRFSLWKSHFWNLFCHSLAQHTPCCSSWHNTSSQTLSHGDIFCYIFVDVKGKFCWALKMSYCVWFTCRQHTVGVSSYSREFYRKKRRASKQSGQMFALETTALPLPRNSLSFSLFFFTCSLVTSLCLSVQTMVFPLLFSPGRYGWHAAR